MRFAIVGCGVIGKEHVRTIGTVDGAELSCVVDTDAERAAQFQEAYGIPGLTDLDAALRAGRRRCGRGVYAERAARRRGRRRPAGRQARHRRETTGDHARRGRSDRRGGGGRRHRGHGDQPAPVRAGLQLPARGCRQGSVRHDHVGLCVDVLVAQPGLLRLRRLARHLGARRWRRADEPGHPQHRPADLAARRAGRGHGVRRYPRARAARGRGHRGRDGAFQRRRAGRHPRHHRGVPRADRRPSRSSATAVRRW